MKILSVGLIAILVCPVFAQVCSDCNGDGVTPSILDALTGAQISVALVSPTATQQIVCDVNASGSISVIDALIMAQAAVGLAPQIVCPNNAPTCSYLSPPPGSGPYAGPIGLELIPAFNRGPVRCFFGNYFIDVFVIPAHETNLLLRFGALVPRLPEGMSKDPNHGVRHEVPHGIRSGLAGSIK